MPQLDLITLFDQFFSAYILFISLHFFVSVGPIPSLFEVLYTRHLVYRELFSINTTSELVATTRLARFGVQEKFLNKLINSLFMW